MTVRPAGRRATSCPSAPGAATRERAVETRVVASLDLRDLGLVGGHCRGHLDLSATELPSGLGERCAVLPAPLPLISLAGLHRCGE